MRNKKWAMWLAFGIPFLLESGPSHSEDWPKPDSAAGQTLAGIVRHRLCVSDYAEKYAFTKKPPGDIATAAVPGCRGMLNEFLNGMPIDQKAKDQLRPELEALARELAVKAVLEKRYPTVK